MILMTRMMPITKYPLLARYSHPRKKPQTINHTAKYPHRALLGPLRRKQRAALMRTMKHTPKYLLLALLGGVYAPKENPAEVRWIRAWKGSRVNGYLRKELNQKCHAMKLQEISCQSPRLESNECRIRWEKWWRENFI